jgi:hypothetical protein
VSLSRVGSSTLVTVCWSARFAVILERLYTLVLVVSQVHAYKLRIGLRGTYVPRNAKNSELRHSGLTALGKVGVLLTSIETPAKIPPLPKMDLIALTREVTEFLDATRERGMRLPPRLNSVIFISGLRVLKAS